MDVSELTSEPERRAAVPILRQLWSDEDPADVFAWTGDEDYHLFGAYEGDDLVGVAGVLERGFLHHERHAWLYDLVVDEPRRGEGVGAALLEFVEAWAEDRGCTRVALASPLGEDEAQQFYEDNEYERWGYVIETEL